MMPWHIPVFARVVAAHMATPILSKKLAGKRSRTRSIRFMFLVCALLAATSVMITRSPVALDARFLAIAALGVANSFGVYAMWRAQAISLSRQALFTFMDDVIPVVMGYFLLGERKIFSPFLAVGVVICVGSVIAHTVMESRAKAAQEKSSGAASPVSIFVWIAIYSLIWGVAHFAFRFYALEGLALPVFLLGWYGGSFIGSNFVMLLAGAKEKGEPLPSAQKRLVAWLAFIIAICLALEYWASMYAPLAVTQPIFQVTEMIFPTLIGLFYFKEIKEFTLRMKAVFLIAFTGSLIVALSY